jgi:hypothetical protein
MAFMPNLKTAAWNEKLFVDFADFENRWNRA